MAKKSITEVLVKQLFLSKLHGRSPDLYIEDIEPDGRKAKKVLKELVKTGEVGVEIDGTDCAYSISDKVLHMTEPAKPDLIATLQGNDWGFQRVMKGERDVLAWGVPIDSLHVRGLAYVCLHPEEYEFRYANGEKFVGLQWGKPVEWDSIPYQAVVAVTHKTYQRFVAGLQFQTKVDEMLVNNVSWGLVNVCGVSEEDAKFVESGPARDLFASIGGVSGGSGPYLCEVDDWGARMEKASASILAEIARLAMKAEALGRIEVAVAVFGGWEKFRVEFRSRVQAHLGKEAEKGNTQEGAMA